MTEHLLLLIGTVIVSPGFLFLGVHPGCAGMVFIMTLEPGVTAVCGVLAVLAVFWVSSLTNSHQDN